jgi:hypothetical protein
MLPRFPSRGSQIAQRRGKAACGARGLIEERANLSGRSGGGGGIIQKSDSPTIVTVEVVPFVVRGRDAFGLEARFEIGNAKLSTNQEQSVLTVGAEQHFGQILAGVKAGLLCEAIELR